MKVLLLTFFTVVLMFVQLETNAQDKKTKIKNDKVKMKDGDKKIKKEGDEVKIKDGNVKTKTEDGETKTKDGNVKTKTEGGEIKVKDGDSKLKVDEGELKVKNDAEKLKVDGVIPMDVPYRADYSSQFIMGNPAHATRILELWKDYDENSFQRHRDYYADTATFITSDGMVWKGRDSSLAMVSKYRSGLTNVKSTVDAWLPIKSTDRNEDWVAIWGTETATDSQGKTTTHAIHEIWRFNKDGKVAFMRQYAAQQPK